MGIRAPREGEAAALASLSEQLGYPATAEQIAARLTAIQPLEDQLVLVATDLDDEPIAWIHAFVARRLASDAFAEVGGLVVSEGKRGEGIGGQLLDAVERWARSMGVGAMRIRSNAIRQGAHEFYLRNGYARTKTSHVFDKRLEQAEGGRMKATRGSEGS